MASAGKWTLGLLLLVVGAVLVARTVATDPASNASVKNLPSAETVAKTEDKKDKAPPPPAADVACKKACIEVNEVANDAVTTPKLAPGSVTLSKLAFEVPNLNELTNEINARKAAEAASKAAAAEARAALDDAAAAAAKNDAAITAAAQNGLVAEAAARNAAVEDITKKFTAGDADLLGRLNKEMADRAAGDDTLQLKLNIEIADRVGAIANLRGELANPNQVAAPIIKINNNEIVGDAVTSDKIGDGEVKTSDIADLNVTNQKLGANSITSNKIKDGEIKTEDLADGAVTLPKMAADSVNSSKIVDGSIATADIGNGQVTLEKLAVGAVDSSKIADGSILAADLEAGFLASLVLESEFTARLSDPSGSTPNNSDSVVDWSKLKNVPAGFADNVDDDGSTGLNTFKNELKNAGTPDTTVNDGNDPVSWFKLKDVPAGFADGSDNVDGGNASDLTCTNVAGCVSSDEISGTIDASKLSGGITGTLISDGTITAADLAGTYDTDAGQTEIVVGAVTSEKIADGTIQGRDLSAGAVTMANLGADVITRFDAVETRATNLETRATNLEARLTNLGAAPATGDTDRLSTTRLTGQTSVTAALDPPSLVAMTRVPLIIPVAGVQEGDLVTVSPPSDLSDDLLFVGYDVQAGGGGVIVYLYNNSAAAIDDGSKTWKIQYLDLTP